MADYFTPTVVQPTIPIADMTPLERLLLTRIFEVEPDGDGFYFFAEEGPADTITVNRGELNAALADSQAADSTANAYVVERLAQISADETIIDLDLTGTSWEFLFQDIVRRSPILDNVTVISAFTCSKMRPDGFGGMAVLITADAIKGKSTNDLLEDFLAETEPGSMADAGNRGSHVLLRLDEAAVRAEIPILIEADESLTTLSPDAVTGSDIRAACLTVAERADLSERRNAAVFRAALAAIREAEHRRDRAA
ncbi:MAG TPA: hypothetical protein VND19_08085 [Acetobacteraceae bacterium]|nr:hypothetical protein [Acetobacteraceae bacterium]